MLWSSGLAPVPSESGRVQSAPTQTSIPMAETLTTLRVFIDDPPDPGRDAAWTVFDAAGRAVRNGRSKPAAWPAASRREAVIAARHGRLVTLMLPPLPPGRAEAAAKFALEDQLADAPEDSHVALDAQRGDGGLRVAIVARTWMSAFVSASQRCGLSWDRAVLESDLAPAPARTWRWCAGSIAQPGFVRTDRGATIAVGPAQADAPPAELALALARWRCARAPAVPVDATVRPCCSPEPGDQRCRSRGDAVALGQARHRRSPAQSIYSAVATAPRRRDPQSIFAGCCGPRCGSPRSRSASTLPQPSATGSGCAGRARRSSAISRRLRVPPCPNSRKEAPPKRRRLQRWRAANATSSIAPGSPHRRCSAVNRRAAPALAALPAGAIRSLSYADGHLVLDLQKTEPAQPSRLQRELQKAGLVAIAAPTAAGARLRVGLN